METTSIFPHFFLCSKESIPFFRHSKVIVRSAQTQTSLFKAAFPSIPLGMSTATIVFLLLLIWLTTCA